MRLLLDTHAFLWWVINDRRLTPPARSAIADNTNEVFVSAASAWEITTKHRLGRFPEAEPIAGDLAGSIARQHFGELPVTVSDGSRAGALPGSLRDPFDRMLIAQALSPTLFSYPTSPCSTDTACNACGDPRPLPVSHVTLRTQRLPLRAQIADYCSWAIQRKWESGDQRSYDLIRDKIRSEFDAFSTGSMYYY